METTERIVEAYVRYVRGWATIPNIPCKGQHEVDLLAIDPVNLDRYHIESGVSVSAVYSKLTAKPFVPETLKQRVKKSGQRRTLGYFVSHKFDNPAILETLERYGFKDGNYSKVIVSWGWTPDACNAAQDAQIILWDFRDLLKEIATRFKGQRTYFADDTLRTLHLFARSQEKGD